MAEEVFLLIEPGEAHRAVESGTAAQLVDVREVSETDALRIEGAMNMPLSRLERLAERLDRSRPVYLLCRSGSRAASAAGRLAALGHRDILVVRGGLDAWVATGHPVVHGTSRVWSLERQVRFTAGVLVAAGTAAGFALDPRWLAVPAFVGLGLAFSGATDTCGMALVLARMPWNRRSAADCPPR